MLPWRCQNLSSCGGRRAAQQLGQQDPFSAWHRTPSEMMSASGLAAWVFIWLASQAPVVAGQGWTENKRWLSRPEASPAARASAGTASGTRALCDSPHATCSRGTAANRSASLPLFSPDRVPNRARAEFSGKNSLWLAREHSQVCTRKYFNGSFSR